MSLVALNGFYQMTFGVDLIKGYKAWVPGRYLRMRSSFGAPNDLSTFLLLAVPIAFSFWASLKKWRWLMRPMAR